jgi:DHA2 family multidrug resistance protein
VSVGGYEVTPNRGLLSASIMLCTMMTAIDTTIANVALPHMMGSVSASADEITWVLTSYIVAGAIATPLTGWLEARVGRKVVFLGAIGGFTAASMLCGLAETLPQIVLFRILQGAVGAPLGPLAQAQLLDMNPPEKHGPAMALFGMGTLLGPIMGPPLGGYLTDHFTWRWCFYINAPIGALAFLGVFALHPNVRRTVRRRFDFMGFGLLVLFIASFQLMLDRGSEQDWFSAREIWVEAVVAAIALWMFAFHSASAKQPFFDPRLVRDRNFLGCMIFCLFIFTLTASSLALLPPLLQTLMGYPVQTAGWVMMPRGFGTFASMLIVGRLVARFDNRLILLGGLSLVALAAWQMSHFDLDMSARPVVVAGIVQGLGLGLIMVPISTVAFVSLPMALRAEGSSLLSIMRNLGQSVGISMMQTLLTRHTQAMHAALAAHVVPTDPVVRSALSGLGPAGTVAALDAEINRQASMVAYLDDFRLMTLIAFLCMPLLVMMSGRRATSRL